jgi:hypothetical protein
VRSSATPVFGFHKALQASAALNLTQEFIVDA